MTQSVDELIERVGRRLRRAGILSNVVGTIDTFIAVGAVLAIFVGEGEANHLAIPVASASPLEADLQRG